MTPDQVKKWEEHASEAKRLGGFETIHVKADDLLMLLALAKAAIPSGQVKEDEGMLHAELDAHEMPDEYRGFMLAALSRLAAQAQSADHWRQVAEERAKERDRWRQRAEAAEKRCAELSAVGQVLSEHVDKEQCPCLTDSPTGAERLCPEHDAPAWSLRDELAMVAMHTVVTVCKEEIDDGRLDFRTVSRRAYGMADEMLKARGAK